jgi:hypothetical protein
MHKKSIITQLTEEQSVLLPTELWENIENATSSHICILYENQLNNEVIVKIIDYYSGTMLEEILIKD